MGYELDLEDWDMVELDEDYLYAEELESTNPDDATPERYGVYFD